MNQVKTSVIGSYPARVDNARLMDRYFNQKDVSWENYIDNAVDDQLETGLDIISDGQTRDPFVNIYLRKLKGCRIRDRPEVIDKVEYAGPITIDDQKYVKKLLPKDKQLVGLITGPYTLMKSCVDLFYNDEKQLALDLAYALQKEVQNLQDHVDLISIDEPFFSVEMPNYGKELIEILTKEVSKPVRLHICGDVSKIIPQIIEMPVDILSHEFKASPHLFASFQDYSFKQKICLGSIRSDDTRIETVEEIIGHIEKGIDVFGDQIVQISPDCGLRMLPRDVAFQKLKNLVKAGEKVYGR